MPFHQPRQKVVGAHILIGVSAYTEVRAKLSNHGLMVSQEMC